MENERSKNVEDKEEKRHSILFVIYFWLLLFIFKNACSQLENIFEGDISKSDKNFILNHLSTFHTYYIRPIDEQATQTMPSVAF